MHEMHCHIYVLWTSHLGCNYSKCDENDLNVTMIYF